MVEHITTSGDSVLDLYTSAFVLEFGGVTNRIRFFNNTDGSLGKYFVSAANGRALKLPGGAKISFDVDSALEASWTTKKGKIVIFGMLVYPSDLYASIQSETKSMLVANGGFSVDVLSNSSRPGVLEVKESEDLLSWKTVRDAQVAKKDTDIYSISARVPDKDIYYLKYLLKNVTP